MIKEISANQLEQILKAGAELVDVRENEELEETCFSFVKNWPLSSFESRRVQISQTNPTIFYCMSGLRSLKAAEIANNWTSQDVYFIRGGMESFLHQQNSSPTSCKVSGL